MKNPQLQVRLSMREGICTKEMDGGHGNNEISWSTRSIISPNIEFLMKKNQDRMMYGERIGGRSKLPNVMLYGVDNPSLRPR